MSKFNIFEKNIRKLFKLQKKYPINSLIYKKINIFPLIRLSLFRAEYENDIKKKLITNNIFSKILTLFKILNFI